MSPVCLWLSVILSVAVSWQSHTQEHICIPFSNSSTHVFRWHLHAWPRENRVAVTSFSPLMSIWHLDTACLLVFPPMSCFSPLFSTLEKKLFEEGQTLLLPVVPSRVFFKVFLRRKKKRQSVNLGLLIRPLAHRRYTQVLPLPGANSWANSGD